MFSHQLLKAAEFKRRKQYNFLHFLTPSLANTNTLPCTSLTDTYRLASYILSMEVGKAATHSPVPHYARRWDSIGPNDPFYTADSWKDRNFSGLAATTHTWSECSATSASPSSPSLSSGLPPDGGVDKVLLHNLVEMIPLVETFMEQKQINRSFSRHASLVYTPNPRDAVKASEHGFRAKKGHSQLFQDNYVDQNTIITHLQDQMEQLEQKLLEKDNQLQAVENSMRQTELKNLQASVEELQEQMLLKETEIDKTTYQLSHMQHEVESLQCLLKKAESDANASNLNAARVHEESQSLQCQMAALLLWMESIASCLSSESEDKELENLLKTAESTMVKGKETGKYQSKVLDADGIPVELTRRKYSAALIAAKHNPTHEMLLLVAELRGQLQASLLLSEKGMWV
ncbi:hypothetical protein L7F22_067386 [Adiantum nelumboides]|nr:hypothetical protein [Adiantum nelumboides]